MTPKQKSRLQLVVLVVAGVGVATALGLVAFQENLRYFVTPSQVAAGEIPKDSGLRIGGMVVDGSVQREGIKVRFELTDTVTSVPVEYAGILPDLFREGQGIVAQGTVTEAGVFSATEVLAKHDENYMPPEASEAVRQSADYKRSAKDATQQKL